MDPQPLHPAIVEYEDGRAGRQQVFCVAGLLIFLAVMGIGIWTIIASHVQFPGQPGAWLGTAFGLMFALLGLAISITAVEVLLKVRRLDERGRALLVADSEGITGIDGELVSWQQIDRIEATATGPAPHGSNRLARLNLGHRLGYALKGGLDRMVGVPLGVRDGKRHVRVLLHDGTDRRHELTLPVGPARFTAVLTALGEHAAHNDVAFFGPR